VGKTETQRGRGCVGKREQELTRCEANTKVAEIPAVDSYIMLDTVKIRAER